MRYTYNKSFKWTKPHVDDFGIYVDRHTVLWIKGKAAINLFVQTESNDYILAVTVCPDFIYTYEELKLKCKSDIF